MPIASSSRSSRSALIWRHWKRGSEWTLCLLFEHSNSLRQNVDAYATNIDAFGCRLEPGVDLEADDADRRVSDSILYVRDARVRTLLLPRDRDAGKQG